MRTTYSRTQSVTARHVTPVTNASNGKKCKRMNGIDERRLMRSLGAHCDGSLAAFCADRSSRTTPRGRAEPCSIVTGMGAPGRDGATERRGDWVESPYRLVGREMNRGVLAGLFGRIGLAMNVRA